MDATKTPVETGIRRPRPVLMIPLRRCGSHALRLRLNFNTAFYAPYPLHIVDFMPLVNLYGDLGEDRNYFQLIVDVIGLQTVSMVKWPDIVFDPIEIFDALKDKPRGIHQVVWELLFRAGEKRGARVVMDKSLDSVHYAEELLVRFPDMLFLNVLRDPRAQVNSMNKAIIHDFDSLLNALTWKRAYTKGAELAKQYPDKVLTIRYEDFVGNQEAVLRRVCEFFGIEFMPEMLDVSRSEEAQRISTMSALWESNKFPPITANLDKFKKSLSPRDIEIIETVCGDFMDQYGYSRLTPGKAAISKAATASAKKLSEEKKKLAWTELAKKNYQDYVLRRARAQYLETLKRNLSASVTKCA